MWCASLRGRGMLERQRRGKPGQLNRYTTLRKSERHRFEERQTSRFEEKDIFV